VAEPLVLPYLIGFWGRIRAELQNDGAASAVHQLWLLRRQSPEAWHEFARNAADFGLPYPQLLLLSCLWELSKEEHLSDIAARLAALPDHLLTAFHVIHD